MNIKIYSLNVRGLRERLTQRKMFNNLGAKQFSILLGQEFQTDFSEHTNSTWPAERGYKTLFSCCSSASTSRRVQILFNNNLVDLLFAMKKNEKLITLASIYTPNDDDIYKISNVKISY